MSLISTPCRNICVLDKASGLCTGCGRSLAEIEAWPRLDERQRREIMEAIVRAGMEARTKAARTTGMNERRE